MSDNNTPRPDTGVPGLAFIVGGLVVAVIIAYFLFSGGYLGSNNAAPAQNSVNVEVNNPPSQAAPAPAPEPAPPPSESPPVPGQQPTPPSPPEPQQPPPPQ